MNKWIVLLCCFLGTPLYADIQSEAAFTPQMQLHHAIKANEQNAVATLLETVGVNHYFEDGTTALHTAVIHGEEAIVKLLIEKGADINAPDRITQATPLHLAALHGKAEMATLLLHQGARVNAPMKFGITPLQVAVQFHHPHIVQLLLKHKANINQLDEDGFTALHGAAQNGDQIITEILINHGANPHIKDKRDQATPLAMAISNRHEAVAALLKLYEQ